MKSLLLFPLVLVLTSCSYGSLYEAQNACDDWVDKNNEKKSTKVRNFYCIVEEETNQVLGTKDDRVLERFGY